MSYFKLINGIKDTLRTDARVITITEGYVDGTIEENLNIYTVVVSVLDIVTENNNITQEKFLGNDNLQEVYNNTDNIIRRFFMLMRRNSIGESIYIDGQPTFDKVLDTETQNRLAGWDLTFNIGVPSPEIDVCVNP